MPKLRSTAAVVTTMSALAATSILTGPSVAEPFSTAPCALHRTEAHHSEGVDTWNSAYPRPAGTLDAVMIFLSFPDARPDTTPEELAADHFPATSRFYEQASYGRFTLRPHPLKHWLRMPRPSTAYAIRRDWSAADRAAYLRDAFAAADGEVDFSRYDVVYLVADPDAPGVDSDATKVVNLQTPMRVDGTDVRRVVTVFEKHPPDRLVLAHETGHAFDLPDLYHRPVDGKGDWDTYVGDWDLMGSQFGLAPDLFAWHKWKLGWLDPRQVACVRGTGPTRLTLEPLTAGPGAAGSGTGVPGTAGAPAFGLGHGTKLAVVRTGPDSVLAFEARGPAGNDRAACRQTASSLPTAARASKASALSAPVRTTASFVPRPSPKIPGRSGPAATGSSVSRTGFGPRTHTTCRRSSHPSFHLCQANSSGARPNWLPIRSQSPT